MKIKSGRTRLVKLLMLLAALVLIVPLALGCVRGLQPVGWSGGAVSGDKLYVGTKEGRLVSFNTENQELLWTEPIKAASSGSFLSCLPTGGTGCSSEAAGVAIYGTPVFWGDMVYIGGYNGKVYAYNAETLALRWDFPRDDYLEPIVGGLAIADDRLYFGDDSGTLYALDAATGDKLGEYKVGDKIWSTPVIDGDALYLTSQDHKLYALNAADLTLRWEFLTEGALYATPVVADDTVYIGSFDRYLYAVDAADGHEKWKFMGDKWFWARPAVQGNNIYAACLDGKVYVLSPDGVKVTEFDLEAPISSTPAQLGNYLYFANQEGVIFALDTAANNIRRLVGIEEEVNGPIAAYQDIIYVHTPNLKMHRINAESGAVLPHVSLERK